MTSRTNFGSAALGFALALAPALAFAADVVRRPLGPPAAAAAPIAQKDWSGAYVGVFGGANANGFRSRGAAPNVPALNFSGKNAASEAGAGEIGLRGGYNLQSGDLVYGAEVEAEALLGGKKTSTTALSARQNSRAALRGRLGYSFGSTLLFASAGVSFNPVEATRPATGGLAAAKKSAVIAGGLLGLGAETRITDNLSLRGDLEYGFASPASFTFPGGRTKVETGQVNAKLGLDYHF